MASEKVLLGSSWYRTFGGSWITRRQACWFSLGESQSKISFSTLFSFLLRWFLLLLAKLVSLSFFVKIGLLPWSGHCLIPALGI